MSLPEEIINASGAKLTKKLDNVVREYLHRKYPHPTCFVCKKNSGWFHPKENPRGCQVGHYITRRVYQLRWDLRNIEPHCAPCNKTHNYNTITYTASLIEKYGKERIEYLNETYIKYKHQKMTTKQKKELFKELKQLSNSIPH